ALEETLAEDRSRPCLDPEPLHALWRLLSRVERFFGEPRDVEWCFDGKQFWILQARPLTSAAASAAEPPDVEWTRANLVEVLPELASPQVAEVNARVHD